VAVVVAAIVAAAAENVAAAAVVAAIASNQPYCQTNLPGFKIRFGSRLFLIRR
jgi:hypothetical protein